MLKVFSSNRLIISALTLIALLLASVVPAAAVMVGNDEINFIAVRYNFPNPGKSTWYYQVTSGSRPAISHVTFELNLDCIQILDAGTWNSPNQDSLNSGQGLSELGTDPTTGVTGIKFDLGFAEGETRYYYFTIDGNLAAADNIVVASKGGPGFDTGLITGPNGDCTEVGSPAIDIEKLINDVDADEADGVLLTVGDAAVFTFVVTNTGQVPLANVVVTDDIFGAICVVGSLQVGEAFTCTRTTSASLGLHTNTAVASTTYNSIQVQDSDPANYTASPRFIPAPAIDVEKSINTDDADTAPGPELIEGDPADFTFVVVNTGNVDLTNVSVVDDIFGSICSFASLAVGATETCTYNTTAGLGLHTNVATASGSYNTSSVSDSDPANYTGAPRFIPNPGLRPGEAGQR